jgi:hypothetical protein
MCRCEISSQRRSSSPTAPARSASSKAPITLSSGVGIAVIVSGLDRSGNGFVPEDLLRRSCDLSDASSGQVRSIRQRWTTVDAFLRLSEADDISRNHRTNGDLAAGHGDGQSRHSAEQFPHSQHSRKRPTRATPGNHPPCDSQIAEAKQHENDTERTRLHEIIVPPLDPSHAAAPRSSDRSSASTATRSNVGLGHDHERGIKTRAGVAPRHRSAADPGVVWRVRCDLACLHATLPR